MKYLFNCLMIVGFFASVVVNINTLGEVNYLRVQVSHLRSDAQSLEEYFDNQMLTQAKFVDATYDDVRELKSRVEFNEKVVEVAYEEFGKLCENVNDRFNGVVEILKHN